ncbi:MAG: outer membrane beta-barrel protein [Campylobacterales bacterium]|nr:outer membrane beta-barrel protein [Campylobacterales bacterium]
MKKLASFALVALFSVFAVANEDGLYVGAEVGATHTKVSDDSAHYKADRASEALQLGYYINANSRTYVAYQYIGADANKDVPKSTNIYSVGYDYLFGAAPLKPFVGAVLGYSTYKDHDFKINGLAYGAQAGVDYKVNTNISVDVGYRYLKSTAKATYSGFKSTMDSFQTFSVGVNYKF